MDYTAVVNKLGIALANTASLKVGRENRGVVPTFE